MTHRNSLILFVIATVISVAIGQMTARQNSFDLRRAQETLAQGGTMAWARHITGQNEDTLDTNDSFESVAVMPSESGEDEVWVVVNRPNGEVYHEGAGEYPTLQVADTEFQVRTPKTDMVHDIPISTPEDLQNLNTIATVKMFNISAVFNGGSGTVRLQTSTAHGYSIGETVYVSGTTYYDGTFTILDIPSTTQIKISGTYVKTRQGYVTEVVPVGNYYLTNDINMIGVDFVPIGQSHAINTFFRGNIDGCGYTISNLTINCENDPYEGIGLIGAMDIGVIANLTLSDVSITLGLGSNITGCLIGEYVAISELGEASAIYNCHVSGEINITSNDTFTGNTGGLVGELYNATVYDCTADVDITVMDLDDTIVIGGFVGLACESSYDNCRAYGDIIVGSVHDAYSDLVAGGFVGDEADYIDVFTDCAATGNITSFARNAIGGFTGWTYGTYTRCSARGNITLTNASGSFGDTVGGFTAHALEGTITDCYSWSNIVGSGTAYVGGLAGYGYDAVDNQCTIDNYYAVGEMSGNTVGGLVAYNDELVMTACFWDTESSGVATSDGGEGHITSWMQTKANYESAGWDFTTTWELTETEGYWATLNARYIEQVQPVDFGDQNDAWFVDSAGNGRYAYHAEVPAYWETLDANDYSRLEGREVCLFADGQPLTGTYEVNDSNIMEIVDGNYIDFEINDYNNFLAGLNYYSILETFPFVRQSGQLGLSQSKRAQLTLLKMDFYETMGANVGRDFDNSSVIDFDSELFSGVKTVTTPYGITREPELYMWIWQPVPTTLRGFYPDIDINFDED